MSIILFGQYPRSEPLVKATRELDRGRIREEGLESILKQERLDLKNLQKDFKYVSSGLFQWEDLMRPYIELIHDCQKGPLTRFFETNTFWRKIEAPTNAPILEEQIEPWINKYFFPDQIYKESDSLVFTLPFLFLFRAFSSGIKLDEIQILLFKIVTTLDKKHRGIVIFLEPHIGAVPLGNEEKQYALRFLEKIKSHTTIPIAIMQCFYSIDQEKDFLYSLPVDYFGIDFYSNRLKDIVKHFPKEKSLLAGIMSTESTRLESKDHIHKFIAEISNFLPTEGLTMTTSGPSELLPREVMDKKIEHMKEILQ